MIENTELAFVGCAIIGRAEALPACRLVEPQHLQDDFARDAYRLCRQRHAQGLWASEAFVSDKLRPLYPDAQDRVYAAVALVGSTADPMILALEVLRAAQVRARCDACQRYVLRALENRDDTRALPELSEALARAEKLYSAPESLDDIYAAAIADMDARIERTRTRGSAGISTGFGGVDDLTGGYQPGITVIGGWSSAGKSSLMIGSLVAAMAAGVRVRVYSIDMGAFPLTWRVTSWIKRVDLSRFAGGRLSDEERDLYRRVCERMIAAQCAIDVRSSTIDQLCASLTEYRDTYDIAFIDYAQKIGVQGRAVQEKDRIEQVLSGLAQASTQIGRKPIVLLSQLTDPPSGRDLAGGIDCPRPNANQLRGNRYLTDFAAAVLLVWRARYADPDSDDDRAEVIVAKNQNGAIGTVPVVWSAKNARFIDPQRGAARNARGGEVEVDV